MAGFLEEVAMDAGIMDRMDRVQRGPKDDMDGETGDDHELQSFIGSLTTAHEERVVGSRASVHTEA